MEGTAPEQAKEERPETMYLVLRQIDATEAAATEAKVWVEVGTAGGGPTPAIKALVGETSGAYAAVPTRSWKPREVKVETKPTVTFG